MYSEMACLGRPGTGPISGRVNPWSCNIIATLSRRALGKTGSAVAEFIVTNGWSGVPGRSGVPGGSLTSRAEYNWVPLFHLSKLILLLQVISLGFSEVRVVAPVVAKLLKY